MRVGPEIPVFLTRIPQPGPTCKLCTEGLPWTWAPCPGAPSPPARPYSVG